MFVKKSLAQFNIAYFAFSFPSKMTDFTELGSGFLFNCNVDFMISNPVSEHLYITYS